MVVVVAVVAVAAAVVAAVVGSMVSFFQFSPPSVVSLSNCCSHL